MFGEPNVLVKGKRATVPLAATVLPMVIIASYKQVMTGTLTGNVVAFLLLLVTGWTFLMLHHITGIDVREDGIVIRDLLYEKFFPYEQVSRVELKRTLLGVLSMSNDVDVTVKIKKGDKTIYKTYRIICIENAHDVLAEIIGQMKLRKGEEIEVW